MYVHEHAGVIMDRIEAPDRMQWQIRRYSLALLIMAILAVLGGVAESHSLLSEGRGLSFFFFRTQDILVIVLLFILLSQVKVQPASNPESPLLPGWARNSIFWTGVVPIALAAMGWTGRYLVFQNYDLSRDEQLATFDTYIFTHGRLFWPIPLEWRPYADALNQMFMLPIGAYEAWVSGYLPMNAVLRALVGLVTDPALTGPLLVGIGAIALWQISGRLLADNINARLVTMVLYITSSQVLFMGMTSYAMTPHLTFNLLWLMLFLMDRPAAHAGAVLIGFIATGLHQPLFHPLFVMPFLWMLMRQQRWNLLVIYCSAYTVIGLGWLAWPQWIASHGVGEALLQGKEAASYLDRLQIAVGQDFGFMAIYLMILNLTRFIAWQHLLLVPLMIAGIAACWRSSPIVRALTAGFILPIAIMAIILPYQGHGWGYRYLHGVIGNACLLGGFGWAAISREGRSLRRAFGWATALTMPLILVHAYIGYRMTAPYAKVDRIMSETDTDFVVVDVTAAPFASDLVRNRADLGNRPIRLGIDSHNPQPLGDICKGRSVRLFSVKNFGDIRAFFGIKDPTQSEEQSTFRDQLTEAGCNAQH